MLVFSENIYFQTDRCQSDSDGLRYVRAQARRRKARPSTEERTKSVKEMASFTAPASLASSLGMDFKKS